MSELREHSTQCTGNLFDDSDDDGTDISAAMDGGPHSSNNSTTQSLLDVPISNAAQQPVNVHATSSQQSLQSSSQQLPLQEDSLVAATQAANHASPQSIQDTSQQLGVGNDAARIAMVTATQSANHASPQSIQDTSQQLGVGNDAERSAINIDDIVEQVAIKCAGSGNPVQILQCLQDSVVVGRTLDIVNVSGDVNFILVNRKYF